MKRYMITSVRQAGGVEPLLDAIRRARADMVQIREKDLEPRELCELVRRALEICSSKVLVNTRADVALACGAHGVHLPAGSPSPEVWRRMAPAGFLIGVSCHTLEELRRAAGEGADFAVYGPVFPPLSKVDDRPPVGLVGLREACAAVRLPVFALGGITMANASACVAAGAAGIAGITMFL